MFDTKKFGGYLSRLRKNADMTQAEVADRLNVTRQAISRYEQGDCFPDVSVLVQIADIFHVTLDELIGAGEPSRGESAILSSVARGEQAAAPENIEDIVSLAPYLKPSVLGELSAGLAQQGIDISNIVALAEYLQDDSVIAMLRKANFDTIPLDLMEKLMPFLEPRSKSAIFEKLLSGEVDWHFLYPMLLYSDGMNSHVEAAVVEGALPWEALSLMQKALAEKHARRKKNGE